MIGIMSRDKNGSDTDKYHCYHICFHIFGRIWIRIRIVSTISDKVMSTSQIYDFSIQIRTHYQMLNIQTRIQTYLNPSKRIWS